ncbi:MAG: MBL fold metallo-hydrolase [Anaerolineae bacterium]|nr:MBL fold metallo-hydrolase [Anaerolineae bacterium]
MIEAPGFRMLVEASPGIVSRLDRIGVSPGDIRRIFISHSHGDHTLGFPTLVLSRIRAATRLQVYAAQDTLSMLQMLWTLAYADFDSNYLKCDWHRMSERRPDEVEVAPGVILRTIVVPYPPGATTLAARWDFEDGPSVTFVTDTIPNTASIQLAQGSDLLIHEATYSAELQPNEDPARHFHSTARQAGEVARQAGCPRLALVHLGPEISNYPKVLVQEARADTDLQVIVPEDGERVRVDAES